MHKTRTPTYTHHFFYLLFVQFEFKVNFNCNMCVRCDNLYYRFAFSHWKYMYYTRKFIQQLIPFGQKIKGYEKNNKLVKEDTKKGWVIDRQQAERGCYPSRTIAKRLQDGVGWVAFREGRRGRKDAGLYIIMITLSLARYRSDNGVKQKVEAEESAARETEASIKGNRVSEESFVLVKRH